MFLSSSTPPADPNAKIKVIFIYNFTKYIEWPSDYKQGDFLIGVLGNTSLLPDLENLAKTKMIGSQKCTVKSFATVSDIQKCHILFIPVEKSEELEPVLKKIKNMSTLVVTEKEGLARKGSVINFVNIENKQKFELNKTNASKKGLIVSSNLASLGIVID
ncbi:MAG: YfiR family protein [Cytophagaceae bacterium]